MRHIMSRVKAIAKANKNSADRQETMSNTSVLAELRRLDKEAKQNYENLKLKFVKISAMEEVTDLDIKTEEQKIHDLHEAAKKALLAGNEKESAQLLRFESVRKNNLLLLRETKDKLKNKSLMAQNELLRINKQLQEMRLSIKELKSKETAIEHITESEVVQYRNNMNNLLSELEYLSNRMAVDNSYRQADAEIKLLETDRQSEKCSNLSKIELENKYLLEELKKEMEEIE